MDLNDNILQRIREIIGDNAENFSILEHQVDVSIQMEYFEFSRNQVVDLSFDDLIPKLDLFQSPDVDIETKKKMLVQLASFDKPEAYRALEKLAVNPPSDIKDWVSMALHESRMLLESRLMEEQQVFISTGLGGKGLKLRYFVVVFSSSNLEFTQTQKNLISSEFEFFLRRLNCELETIDFNKNYAALIALVPLSVPVRQPFQLAIDECNTLGQFLQKEFIITNVKILTDTDIEDVLNSAGLEEE